MHKISTHPEAECVKGVFQIQPPIFGVYFSNNMSTSQAKVKMSETEYYTIFETSKLLTSMINLILPRSGKTFGFTVFRLQKKASVKLALPLHNATISPPCRTSPCKFARKGSNIFFKNYLKNKDFQKTNIL